MGLDEVSSDGLFTISEVECLGACVNAPMMQVNNEWFYEDLTPENVVNLLEDFKNGTQRVGPQNHRKNSEGPQGRTSLFKPEELNVHIDRDFAVALKEYEEAKAKAAAAAAAAKK